MSPAEKGMLLGAIDAVVVAALLLATFGSHLPARELASALLCCSLIGTVPGAMFGAIAGVIAEKLRRPRMTRVAACACAALGAALVACTGPERAVVHGWVLFAGPTVVLASVFDRWTRRDVTPRLPNARVVAT